MSGELTLTTESTSGRLWQHRTGAMRHRPRAAGAHRRIARSGVISGCYKSSDQWRESDPGRRRPAAPSSGSEPGWHASDPVKFSHQHDQDQPRYSMLAIGDRRRVVGLVLSESSQLNWLVCSQHVIISVTNSYYCIHHSDGLFSTMRDHRE